MRLPASFAFVAALASASDACRHTGIAFTPLNRTALRASQPKTVLLRMWTPPRFNGSATQWIYVPLFVGPLSAVVLLVDAGKEVKPREIKDPAHAMRLGLADALAQRFTVSVVQAQPVEEARPRLSADSFASSKAFNGTKQESFGDTERHALAKNGQGSLDLALDVQTTRWGIVATRWRHFAVDYRATLKLTDLRNDEVLAEATCDGLPTDHPSNPTADELNQAGPERLKSMVDAAGAFCFDDFRMRVLGLHR